MPEVKPLRLSGGKIKEFAATDTIPVSNNNASVITRVIGITVDGNGGVISTGVKGYIKIPFACTINSWSIVSNASGSVVVDVWKAANAIPTVANTITAAAKPSLTSQQINSSSTLTGWATAVSANDVIGFNIDSATTVSRITIEIIVTLT